MTLKKIRRCEILHVSDAHTKKDIYIFLEINIFYKTFPALNYKQFLMLWCYHNNGSSIASAFTKTSSPIENYKW
jgi:hypothetical protein